MNRRRNSAALGALFCALAFAACPGPGGPLDPASPPAPDPADPSAPAPGPGLLWIVDAAGAIVSPFDAEGSAARFDVLASAVRLDVELWNRDNEGAPGWPRSVKQGARPPA